MADEICFRRGPNGAFCTLPEGHTGDHIAESAWKGNIIDAFREDEGNSSRGSSGVVKIKGGCAVIALAFVGGMTAAVFGATEVVRHIL